MTRSYYFAFISTMLLSPAVRAQESDAELTDNRTGAASTIPEMPDVDEVFTEDTDGSPLSAGPSTPRPEPIHARSAAGQETTSPSREEVDALAERLDMMEGDIERLLGEQDRLNAQKALDRLNWSGSYRFGANFFHLKMYEEDTRVTHLVMTPGVNGPPVFTPHEETVVDDRDDWVAPTWTHRLKLAMSYDFGRSLRFYSQLGVFKYFNETRNTIGSIDHGSNAYPRDNAFRLERVYFDWFIANWFVLSVGRIASPDGPPTELKENAERRSGWGVQMVNATIDTVMSTIYLGEDIYLRVFYSPFGIHSDYTVVSEISLFDDQNIELFHSWGGLFEVGLPGSQDSIFQIGVLHVPRFSPRDTRIRIPGSDVTIGPSAITGDSLGWYMGANSLLLFKNIMNSGLDIFAAYSLTMLKPTEGRMVYNIPITLSILDQEGESTNQVSQTTRQQSFGLASYDNEDGNDTNLGHAVYAGLRYTLPTSDRYPTRIGGEFNWGSKYHLAWSHPNDQLVNKLGNKGITAEGYIIQQLVPNHLFLRVGYIELHRDYEGQFIGPTRSVDQRIRNIYFLADLSW